jgi:hypothetical protein
LDTVDREIEELKTELKIDQHSKIHFIQGSFCKYYKEGDILGEGTSGVVKKCSKVCTKEYFAVKIVQYKGDMEILTLVNKKPLIRRFIVARSYKSSKTFSS